MLKKNKFVKKTEFHELVKKINAIQVVDASNLVENYDTEIGKLEKNISDYDHNNKYLAARLKGN